MEARQLWILKEQANNILFPTYKIFYIKVLPVQNVPLDVPFCQVKIDIGVYN